MKHNILDDTANIRTAVLYKRGQMPTELDETNSRKPYKLIILAKSDGNDHSSFTEYNFKFKVDKGESSSFTIHNYLNDYTSDLLLDSNESNDYYSYIINNLLVYQNYGESNRDYSFSGSISTDSSSTYILDLDEDIINRSEDGSFATYIIDSPTGTEEDNTIINKNYGPQKIEFYNRIITDISEIPHEYIEGVSTESPSLIIEFGPDISYEREDYFDYDHYKEIILNKPSIDEIKYQSELDEFSNRKILTITLSSDNNISSINLSLNSHLKEKNPHRNQSSLVLNNKDWRLGFYDKNIIKKVLSFNVDRRSSTILSNKNENIKSCILFNSKCKGLLGLKEVNFKSMINDDPYWTIKCPIYRSDIVYNYNDKVIFGKENKKYPDGTEESYIIYKSLIDNNLGELPNISPVWELYDPRTENWYTENLIRVIVKNTSDNHNNYSNPIGECYFDSGSSSVYLELTTDELYSVKSVLLNGSKVTYTLNGYVLAININEFLNDNLLEIVYEKTKSKLEIECNPNIDGVSIIGSGIYDNGSEVSVSSVNTNDKYLFSGWIDENKNYINSNTSFKYTINNNTKLFAQFNRRLADVYVDCIGDGECDTSHAIVNYGDELSLQFLEHKNSELYNGFIIHNESGNEIVEIFKDLKITISNIKSNYSVKSIFGEVRPTLSSPILGIIPYVTIGNQQWTVLNLNLLNQELGIVGVGVNDVIDSELGRYYSIEEVSLLDNLLSSDESGFRIPHVEDWNILSDYIKNNSLDNGRIEKNPGMYLRSFNYYKVPGMYWENYDNGDGTFSNYSGIDITQLFKSSDNRPICNFNSYPSGYCITATNEIVDRNISSNYWTKSLSRSYYTSTSMNNSNFDLNILGSEVGDKSLQIRLVKNIS